MLFENPGLISVPGGVKLHDSRHEVEVRIRLFPG